MHSKQEMITAAQRLLENDDLKMFVNVYLANLQQDIMDSDDEKTIMKLHNQHAAVRDFAEFIRMTGEKPLHKT